MGRSISGARAAQLFGVTDGTAEQGIEVFGVGLVEPVGLADVGFDGARVLVVEQPLVQALQRELARAMTRGAVLVRIGVWSFVRHDECGRALDN
jgi:hypothetical protein